MKKLFFGTIVVVAIINIAFAIGTAVTKNSILMTFAIVTGTVLYHLAMRLVVGYGMPHCFCYQQRWFAPLPFESALYKRLGVKRWKKHMPSFSPDTYSAASHSYEEIANTMCRNEVIHSLNVLLSLVPIVFSVWFGSLGVFLATSVLAGLCDLSFVIMQRYNRPRIVRIIKRRTK